MTQKNNQDGFEAESAEQADPQGDVRNDVTRGASAARSPDFIAGTIAIVGRPNVGKSVLLNQIVGQKLAIVSPRPQTTRNRIVGVFNDERGQIVFVDTPGIHRAGHALNRFMNEEARDVIEGVDAVLVVVDAGATLTKTGRRPFSATPIANEDQRIVQMAATTGKPVVLALNKVDQVKDKPALFPLLEHWSKVHTFETLVPISGLKGSGVKDLISTLMKILPKGDPLYDEDMLTDRSERFLVSELIREQVFTRVYEELPYAVAVQIDQWEDRAHKQDVVIDATILVEKTSQKTIMVGKGGSMIREVGMAARREASELLGRPVHIKLFVKVVPDWSSSPAHLSELGYRSGGE